MGNDLDLFSLECIYRAKNALSNHRHSKIDVYRNIKIEYLIIKDFREITTVKTYCVIMALKWQKLIEVSQSFLAAVKTEGLISD